MKYFLHKTLLLFKMNIHAGSKLDLDWNLPLVWKKGQAL